MQQEKHISNVRLRDIDLLIRLLYRTRLYHRGIFAKLLVWYELNLLLVLVTLGLSLAFLPLIARLSEPWLSLLVYMTCQSPQGQRGIVWSAPLLLKRCDLRIEVVHLLQKHRFSMAYSLLVRASITSSKRHKRAINDNTGDSSIRISLAPGILTLPSPRRVSSKRSPSYEKSSLHVSAPLLLSSLAKHWPL